MSYVRSASHAGPNGSGWYESAPKHLKQVIDDYFGKCDVPAIPSGSRLMGVISPHAGMAFCGGVASTVYSAVRAYIYRPDSVVERIFILRPSHHKAFNGVEIAGAKAYKTPFGAIKLDVETVKKVMDMMDGAKVPARFTSQLTDEEEHSIEMQMPYIAHLLRYPPEKEMEPALSKVHIVPIIVGVTDRKMEDGIFRALRSYMEDPRNLFVFSSDFCHWGSRFHYTYHYNPSKYPEIGDAIIAMDHEGMSILEKKDTNGWYDYMDRTENTICGRHAISAGVNWWSQSDVRGVEVKFVAYDQSTKCSSKKDSSVSYAGAIVTQPIA